MLSVTQTTEDIVIVDAAGKLTRDDYARFDQELESVAERDHNMKVLIRLTDFHGWEPEALWEDVKLDMAYKDVLHRVAVVGDKKWEEWMMRLSRPFIDADVRYFDQNEAAGAVGWLLEKE